MGKPPGHVHYWCLAVEDTVEDRPPIGALRAQLNKGGLLSKSLLQKADAKAWLEATDAKYKRYFRVGPGTSSKPITQWLIDTFGATELDLIEFWYLVRDYAEEKNARIQAKHILQKRAAKEQQ